MPNMTDIQNKILKINSNKAVPEKTKLAIRKQFYILKNQELDLETQVLGLSEAIDDLMKKISKQAQPIQPVSEQNDFSGFEESAEEEIVTPTKQQTPGVKVRMQEEIDESEDDEFEVPFEAEDK